MKEEEIKRARNKYKELLGTYRTYLKLKERISELEKDALVSEYLTLVSMIDKIQVPEDIEFNAFNDIANKTKDKDEVVVYGGIKNRWLNTPCFVYRGLDTGTYYDIDLNKYEDFENAKDIIKLQESLYTCTYPDALGEYYDLRLEYFKQLVTNDSDASVKEAVKQLKANFYKKGKKVD